MFLNSWEDFKMAAEKLYVQDPMKVRYSMKYDHSKCKLEIKMTDDAVCLQYKTDSADDMKKMEVFVNSLIRLMVSKDT